MNVCIIQPSRDAYSETFIRSHIEMLPGTKTVLYGGYFPCYSGDAIPLIPPARLPARAWRGLKHRCFGVSAARLRTQALTNYLLKQRVDVVLAEYGETGSAVLDACIDAGVPLVVHFHGYDAYCTDVVSGEGQGYRELFRNAKAIVAVSRHMERQLESLGAPRSKIFYCPYGIDSSLFGKSQPEAAPSRFLAVGRFVEKKCPYLTILAFQRVHERIPDARLVMIGDGPLLGSCRQMARSLGMSKHIEFPGPCEHKDIAAWMQKSRAFVQHSARASNGDSEGTPLAILEAGTAGLPVVATRHTGIVDAVVEGKTGFLVDEGDIDAMAEHMLSLAQSPELAARMGAAARIHIRENYALEKQIQVLARILASAAE